MKKKIILKKKAKAANRYHRKTSRKKNSEMMKKLDTILSVEKKLLDEEKKIETTEKRLEREEEEILKEDKTTLLEERKEDRLLSSMDKEMRKKEKETDKELSEIEKLELDIKKEVGQHPLTKIGFKDAIKGMVGAFVGLAVHYTFTYGVELSEKFDITRSILLYGLSFFVGLLFIYATGFRKVKDPQILIFMPVRLLVLYVISVVVSIFVLWIFYPGFGNTFEEGFRMVAGVLLAAVVGACTADLIGKE
jgi:uncharacterized membrane protein